MKSVAVNLVLFVGVCVFAGMVGWLLGSAMVDLGGL